MSHVLPIRVYYEDTDLSGLVYHANYLKFIERARSEWVRSLGIDQAAMKAAGSVFVVSRVEADYLSPARYDDELVVTCEPEAARGARLVVRQEVLRGEEVLFRALVTVVTLGPDGRPKRLPAGLGPAG